MNKTFAAITTALTLMGTTALAEGNPEAGKAKAGTCAGCHGAEGVSMAPIYPNLAGQKAPYLVSALKAYKSQERKGGNAAVMWGIAASLSDEDIENLAAYYASLEPGS